MARKALNQLRQIEYRPATTAEDLEAIYRLRYDCYLRYGYIEPNAEKLSYDVLDEDPHVMRFGVYLSGKLVSSIRLHHLTAEKRLGTSMTAYPDIVGPMLDAGMTMIDPGRLTIDHEASREYPLLPYLTVRLAAMASVHFDVDYCLSTVRPAHGAFYSKVIESRKIDGPRRFPHLAFDVDLYASEVREAYGTVFRKYPFFHSLPLERRMLFSDPWQERRKPLAVLPTAGFVVTAA